MNIIEAIKDSKEIIETLSNHKDKDFIGRVYYKNKPIEEILEILVQALENSIPKEVVEKKIEELDKEEQEAQDSIGDEEREEYSDASISYLLANIETRRSCYKELLEGK